MITVKELIDRLPHDTQSRVEKTRRQWNSILRTALRSESRLFLKRARDTNKDQEEEAVAVPVSVVPGCPEALQSVKFDEDFWLIAILSRNRRGLEQMRDGATSFLAMAKEIRSDHRGEDALQERDSGLPAARELSVELLARLDKYDPVKIVLAVNEDVLGVYRYLLPSRFRPEDPWKGSIELYWGVIGVVAASLGVKTEALTVVVLAHELAHAYTHLGADIDGKRWASIDFRDSAHPLKEGLAQYYTHRVLDRLRVRIPEAFAAFEQLLPRQPDAYRTHKPWVADYSPEEIRMAMIEVRRKGASEIQPFEERLRKAHDALQAPESFD